MAAYSSYALRVPASLMADLRAAAARDGVSMNGFVVQAVAEKIAIMHARRRLGALSPEAQETYLATRAARAEKGKLTEILQRAGTSGANMPGDDVPPGWLGGAWPPDARGEPEPRER